MFAGSLFLRKIEKIVRELNYHKAQNVSKNTNKLSIHAEKIVNSMSSQPSSRLSADTNNYMGSENENNANNREIQIDAI